MAENDSGAATGSRSVQCVVVTPEATVLDATADFVAVPLYDGELGIAPGRAPLIGRLGFGELRLVNGGSARRFYVDGGFIEVKGDVVTLLTGRAAPAGDLDAAVAAQLLDEAKKRPGNTPELAALKERAELQARAQVRLAEKGRS
jgi:F-type H+-transporting ATPase subunit epsilon